MMIIIIIIIILIINNNNLAITEVIISLDTIQKLFAKNFIYSAKSARDQKLIQRINMETLDLWKIPGTRPIHWLCRKFSPSTINTI